MEEVFRGMWVVAYRELLRFVQERSRIISSFAMPIIFLVIFGAGFSRLIGTLAGGVNFVQFMYPGIIAMTVLTNSVMSGLSVVWDREFGFLKEILVAPIARSGIVLGKAAGSAVVAVMQGIIMLVIAPIVGVSITPLIVAQLIPMMILISLSLSGLGVLIASRMRSQQGFGLIVQLIIFPLIFLSGVFFPMNSVPPALATISKFNPLTYGVDAVRQLFLSKEIASGAAASQGYAFGVTIFGHTMTMAQDILVVLVFGVVLLAIAAKAFSRQE